MTFEEKVDREMLMVRRLLLAKDRDYGSANLDKHGIVGITIRMSDKLARLENVMMKKECAVPEKVEDTLRDLIGYAIQYLIRLEKGAANEG